VQIHCTIDGSGDPVVLIHGLPYQLHHEAAVSGGVEEGDCENR
jgi:hypothetical protein